MVKSNTNDFELRRVQNLKGASIGLTIPAGYARKMGIKAKDFLKIQLAENTHLIIMKM